MRILSIRWQLSLSYAAIAFLAALCLGGVLLTVLNQYYENLERQNLRERAETFSVMVADVLLSEDGDNRDALNAQIRNLAFLSNMRVQLEDISGDIIADSGSPAEAYIEISADSYGTMFSGQPVSDDEVRNWATINLVRPGNTPFNELPDATSNTEQPHLTITPPSNILRTTTTAPGMLPPFDTYIVEGTGDGGNIGFYLRYPVMPDSNMMSVQTTEDDEPRLIAVNYQPIVGFTFYETSNTTPRSDIQRSQEQEATYIYDNYSNVIGTLRVSEAPSIGDDIIVSVARGWMVSGLVAVLLAAGAGWLVSTRISAPIVALTDVTSQMTHGDLSARADIQRRDEIGTLGQSFNEMAARIENTVRTLRQFVADAAHELHTPLTALRTNLELNNEDHDESLTNQRAMEQLRRLEGLADDLLALSRIESLATKKPHHPVDLTQMVNDISITYASWAEQADIDYLMDIPGTPLTICGDHDQLHRMMCNLLDNAIKFTPQNGTVRVSITPQEHDVAIVVADTGIGIPPDDMPHLFNRFHRARNTNNYPGSGLGLAIVKAIVDGHHGSVKAESSPRDTHLTVTLPLAKP